MPPLSVARALSTGQVSPSGYRNASRMKHEFVNDNKSEQLEELQCNQELGIWNKI